MIDDEKDASAGDDSSSYLGNIVIGLVLAALYFGSQFPTGRWLSEAAFFCIAVTVALLYNVTGPFRNYWAKPRFWGALVILFAGHAVLLGWYVNGHVVRWSFWGFMKIFAPEGLAMILILGWALGDNYFTRNTRRERARATAQEERGGDAGGTKRAQRAAGPDHRSSSEKNSWSKHEHLG